MRLAIVVLIAIAGACRPDADHPISSWVLDYDGTSTPVTVPTHLDLPDHETEYTLRTELAIPPEMRDRPLSLVIPYFGALATLQVDGIEAVAVDLDLVAGYRGRGPKHWDFPAEVRGRPSVQLTMAVKHRWRQSAWMPTLPRLVTSGTRDGDLFAIRLLNDDGATFGLIGLTLIGLVYLGIFLVDRRRKEYLWFAIQGLSATSYPLFLSGFSQSLFGRYDTAVLAIAMPTAALASVAFTHEALRLGTPSRAWAVLGIVNAVITLAAPDPFSTGTYAARSAIGTIAFIVVYQLVVCGRLALRADRPVGARYLVVAWSFLAFLGTPDFLVWLGLADPLGGIRSGCVGLGLFAIAQALMLGREHIQSLRRSDDLNTALTARVEELEGRQREIELLNQELRRQVGERSEELFGALRTLAATAGTAPVLEEGQIVEQRYRVVRPLGVGGMGAVYEVVRLADDRRFALKVTRERDAVALARLAREAQIAAQVAHPNVVSIVDVDVASAGFLYMVLELVSGKSLHERSDRYRDVDWALPVLAQIAAGLAALHRHGIVHRDLKPANILIDDAPDGAPIVKITDFGISRLAHDDRDVKSDSDSQPTALLKPGVVPDTGKRTPGSASGPLTTTGFVAGTPMYMAPELTAGEAEVAPSADVFSFGIVAFQLLAGHAPWQEPPSIASGERRSIPPPRSLVGDVPLPIAELVERCLAIAPTDRPTALEVAEVLAKHTADRA